MDNRSVYIVSLGCAKNLVDTELAAGSMIVNGLVFADSPENADVYFVNTCAFIAPARQEAEEYIQDAVEWKEIDCENRKIIIGGCLPQWDKDNEYTEEYPEVDLWIGVDQVNNISYYVKELFESDIERAVDKIESPRYLYNESTPRLQLTPAHFAYLKVADGCNNNCTYCSIPAIRGNLRNRPIKSIVAEAKNLVKNGVKELIIAAQDTAAFIDPDNGGTLVDLIKQLDLIDGEFDIRLLYVHPAHLTDDMIAIFAKSKHLLPYIDLPLQHISDSILKSMNRKIDSKEIKEKIVKLRESVPEIAIRTTFLVGYPGESDNDFKELCEFVKKIRFSRLGVFPYCDEAKTPAANFANQVPHEVAAERCDKIMLIQSEISYEENQKLIGSILDVLIDDVDVDLAVGRTFRDAPEIDNIVELKNNENLLPGSKVRVKILSADEFVLKGELI